MDPLLVVQPHMDDAVLSVGQFLVSYPGATVLTIFAGLPIPPVVTTYDVNCGFRDSTQAVLSRWHEDDRAMRMLRAKAVRGHRMDMQYSDPQGRAASLSVASTIKSVAAAIGATKVVGPLGIAHEDHRVVADAVALVASAHPELEVWVYEEIPGWVEHPEEVPVRLAGLRGRGLEPTLGFLGTGPVEEKERVLSCYRSQLWALNQRYLYVPERLWRLSHV